MKLVFRAYLIGLMLAASVLAQNFLSYPNGEYWRFPNARSLALAGAGSLSLQGVGALVYNPAALANGRARLEGEISLTGRKLEERRGFPVFNRIDDVVQNGVYAINNNWFGNFQGGVVFRPAWKGFRPLKAISVGRFTELDQDYDYEEEVRENIFGDSLIAFNRIVQDGRLSRYGIGVAVAVTKNVFLGAQLGVLSGDLSRDSTIAFVRRGGDVRGGREERKLDNTPLVASFGLLARINSRLAVGSYLKLPYSLKYNYRFAAICNGCLPRDVVGRETLEYPLEWTLSAEYQARQALQARLSVEFNYQWWSKVAWRRTINGNQFTWGNYDDVFSVRVGVEHIFYNRIPFQVGLQYRSFFQRKQTTRTLISAGTGFMNRWWRVDVAGGVSRLNYRFPDLFPDTLFGGNRNNSPIDTVQETYFFGLATVRFFVK
ncbi:MAG: hypothetical protein D6715_10520 [Calditrichaeota bacterium]|nr:MAG: hypothetical protein D6715_10520 [Calditrichota bacterium]